MGWLLGDETGASISSDDKSTACQAADQLISSIEDKDVHFQITLMFLSLRKRKWDHNDCLRWRMPS
jgi:hypothetical protein